ncbi:unnamed protein product [Prunus armeniaca]|uniref:Uncharacterized protein n=1 Tax=Prunus armeniaca TaxID=36596 RepID=A0A6J5TRW1_PRUAR|nr:unnamed protein product [Prunus armeniaca]
MCYQGSFILPIYKNWILVSRMKFMLLGKYEKVPPEPDNDEGAYNFYDGEILDEMTTSRGELKLITSFTCSSMEEC